MLRWPEVAAAASRHPLVREAEAGESAAAGAVLAARELPNPRLSLAAGDASPRGGGASRREREVTVEWPIGLLGGRGARVAAARAAEEGARGDRKAARAEALRDLRRAFVALVHGQAAVETGAELEAQVARLAALVRRRVERGEGRPLEAVRVEIELERLRAALDRARAEAATARERLSAWIGAPVARAEADLARSLDLPARDVLLDRALASSPVVEAARARVAAAESAARAERWSRLPEVSLGAAWTEELDRTAGSVSASLSVPLFGWSRGKVRQADAAIQGERARLDAASRALTAGLSEAWERCAAGQAATSRFRERILPRAEESARTLGRAFELGEAGLLDVLDARRVLLETRREHLDLLLDMQNACGDLAAIAGLELP